MSQRSLSSYTTQSQDSTRMLWTNFNSTVLSSFNNSSEAGASCLGTQQLRQSERRVILENAANVANLLLYPWKANDSQLPAHRWTLSVLGKMINSRPISRKFTMKLCRQHWTGALVPQTSFTCSFLRFLLSCFFSSVSTTRKGLHCLSASSSTPSISRDLPVTETSSLRSSFRCFETHSLTTALNCTEYQPVLFNVSEWKSCLVWTGLLGALKAL